MHLNCTHLLTVLPSSERRKSNLRTLFALLVIPASVGMFLGAPPAKAQNAYITNIASSTVSVIDTATNTVTTTISGFSSPWGVAVTPNGLKVYVTNLGSNTVSVIDAVTNMVTGSPITVGTEPISAAVTPDSSTVYVTNFGSSNVSVIDTATNMVTATISVGMSPASVVFTPDGSTAYVGNTGSNTVSVIDTATNTVTTTITGLDATPSGVAITPDGSTVYVANNGSSNVSVIDTATNKVTGSPIPVGANPAGVAITPDGSRVYVANGGSNTVSVIDAVTNMVTGSMIPVGNQPNSFGLFIQPVVLVRFAAFSAKLRSPISSSFRLTGAFTLGADSKGINPVKENVILQIGTFSFTIPSGSFNQAFNGNVRLHRDHRPGELCGPDCADREQEVYLQLYGHRFEFEPGQQGRTWIDRWN
jgi:YVTN family beta-propeller protein